MLLATSLSGFWLFATRYFALEMRPPAHDRASAHFFSEISRLRLARERGSGPGFSTPRVLGFSAAIFAHSENGGSGRRACTYRYLRLLARRLITESAFGRLYPYIYRGLFRACPVHPFHRYRAPNDPAIPPVPELTV